MKDDQNRYQKLMEAAAEARKSAYAPYSHHAVGAALLCADGTVYTGCNIENAGYSATNCAERTAIFKAVSEGARSFAAIAVVGGLGESLSPLCAPCGVCRQVLVEFCQLDMPVILGTPEHLLVCTLGELLPFAFTPADLNIGE